MELLLFWQLHLNRQELGGVATVLVDVADDARRHAHQFAFGEEEDGFQLRMQTLVGVADHVLVLEVAAAAQTTDDGVGTHFLAEVGSEALVALHFHLRIVLENGLAPRDAVLQIKSGTLFHIDADSDINLVEDGQGPQNDAAVPQGDGIEGTGENGYSFHCVFDFLQVCLVVALRHCERSEAIQELVFFWTASCLAVTRSGVGDNPIQPAKVLLCNDLVQIFSKNFAY